jgi:hypothetical protein
MLTLCHARLLLYNCVRSCLRPKVQVCSSCHMSGCICVKDRRRHSDDIVDDVLEPFARSMMVEPITYGRYHDNSIFTECAKAMSDRPPPSCLQCGTLGHLTADCADNPDNFGKRNGNSSRSSRHSTGRINESSSSSRSRNGNNYAAESPPTKHSSDRQRRPASEGSKVRGAAAATDVYDMSSMQPSLPTAAAALGANSVPRPSLFSANDIRMQQLQQQLLAPSIMIPPPPPQPFQVSTCYKIALLWLRMWL